HSTHPSFPTRRSSDLVPSLGVRESGYASASTFLRGQRDKWTLTPLTHPDRLPAVPRPLHRLHPLAPPPLRAVRIRVLRAYVAARSEEHTSELQSPDHL